MSRDNQTIGAPGAVPRGVRPGGGAAVALPPIGSKPLRVWKRDAVRVISKGKRK